MVQRRNVPMYHVCITYEYNDLIGIPMWGITGEYKTSATKTRVKSMHPIIHSPYIKGSGKIDTIQPCSHYAIAKVPYLIFRKHQHGSTREPSK